MKTNWGDVIFSDIFGQEYIEQNYLNALLTWCHVFQASLIEKRKYFLWAEMKIHLLELCLKAFDKTVKSVGNKPGGIHTLWKKN